MLRQAGIAVDLFPHELMQELEELNRLFIRDREALASALMIPGVAEAGLTAFYPSRDYYSRFRKDAETIDRYVSSARRTAVLVSINLMTGVPFHDLCDALDRKLRGRLQFSATISLLDPERSALMDAISPVLSRKPKDLSADIRRTFAELLQLKSKLPQEKRARFHLHAHRAVPFGSAIMLDHRLSSGRIQIETKPYKVGLQRSLAFEVMRRGAGELYDVLAASYERLIDDGREINDGDM